MARKVSDQQFIAAWREAGGEGKAVAAMLGLSIRGVYARRNLVEAASGVQLPSAGLGNGIHRGDAGQPAYNYKPRLNIDGFSGRVVIFSDCHWWPGISNTLAYRALIEIIKETKPKLVIGNGDLLDGARISRFGRSDWSETPKMLDELEEVKARCAEIRHAYRGARHVRTIGNHDQRFDKYLAQNAGEFEGIAGFRLKDHLPEWEETMSIWINGRTVVKHRWHNGINAARNNAMKSGLHFVSGHTHRNIVDPWENYQGRWYGCEDGTLAEPNSAPFAYGEDNPSQARAGFLSLTYLADGTLLPPQQCIAENGAAYFLDEVVLRDRKKKAA